MYMPPAFEEKDPEILWGIVRANSLGLLVSQEEGIPVANAIPFLVKEEGGVLVAHLARANSQWRSLDGQDVLIVFQGANAYITPQWYESKREHGKVVPTWNYAMVQVRGRARVIEDRAWLLEQVRHLTDHHEAGVAGGQAWTVDDAPEDFIQSQLKGIVGLEITVASVTGKLKVSQNRPTADRAGVANGLASQEGSEAAAMVELVRQRSA